ncbi:hypothetical protein [Vibrio phage VCPH]|nr:hypothetical protein [Vibrio phage VCPH]
MEKFAEVVALLFVLLWAAIVVCVSLVAAVIAAILDFLRSLPSGFWVAVAIFVVIGVAL